MTDQPDMPPAYLPLHEWSCLRAELIWIYDRAVRPDHQHWKGKGKEMPGFRMWLIREGSVSMKTESRTYFAKAGTWIMPVKHPLEVAFSRNARILSMHFVCQWPSGEDVLAGAEGISFPSEACPELERMAKGLLRHLQKQFPESKGEEHRYSDRMSAFGDFLNFQALFLRWLAAWFDIEVEHGAELKRLAPGDNRPFLAARCLNLAPLDRGFPEEQLQRQTGLGMMRLNQLFAVQFGLTTRKYWDRRRLELAKQCLETSWMPIKEIAGRLGFRSASHFVIWFRRLADARPGDYRRRYLAAALP